ncbi:MAG: sugar phosphate isomerase/epimerase [Defluviitaleaceae bacterium]|nr:sugar phosphate isomerase/epimerase [Defluviitaleaceae bacterium]
MTKPTVALQLYTVRDFAEKDLAGTLAKISAMGYEAVELAGMYGLKAVELKQMLDTAGLKAISAHVPFSVLEADVAGTVADYKTLGCKVVAIPHMSLEQLPGGVDFEKSKVVLEKAAKLCNEEGLVFGYHNHHFEFEKLPCGAFVLDALFNEFPAADLQAQIDTGWVTVAGQDPVSYIGKYKGRCPAVHLKDVVRVDNEGKTVELLGSSSMLESGEKFEDRPVGQGIQNMPAVTKAAVEAGAFIFVVELDEAVGITSLDAAKESREYLKSIGY